MGLPVTLRQCTVPTVRTMPASAYPLSWDLKLNHPLNYPWNSVSVYFTKTLLINTIPAGLVSVGACERRGLLVHAHLCTSRPQGRGRARPIRRHPLPSLPSGVSHEPVSHAVSPLRLTHGTRQGSSIEECLSAALTTLHYIRVTDF